MAELRHLAGGGLCPAVLGAYADMVADLGRPGFVAGIEGALQRLVPVDRLYLYLVPVDRPDRKVLLRAHYESWLARQVETYSRFHYESDPVQAAFAAAGTRHDVVLQRVGAPDIVDPWSRRWFFDRSSITQRVSVVMRGEGRWVGLNVARRHSSGGFGEDEITRLGSFAQLMLPLLDRHAADPDPTIEASREATTRPPRPGELEPRLAARFPALTPRERQVCARTALGMTAEGIALDLQIGIASVITYRKRAYGRLRISSAYELAALALH
jgi:DNA-binding CsgD family transcriptional regulator